MSDESNGFVLEWDDDKESELLNEFLTREVAQCYVEFLRPGGVKSHVVIKLNVKEPVIVKAGQEGHNEDISYVSYQLNMDCPSKDLLGQFEIKLGRYIASSLKAAVAFQFPVLGNHTVGDWVSILRGRHALCTGPHRGDLTNYSFVFTDASQETVAGCRDFVMQAMVRLNQLGVVGWEFIGQGAENTALIGFSKIREDGFDHVIGKNYYREEEIPAIGHPAGPSTAPDNRRIGATDRRVFIYDYPVTKGVFHDFERVEVYRGVRLPYKQA
ncbi:hypothetical protein SPI_09330 [Niveomyces insectorum RCEF 264]|uniref:Uncharacterized protein n=1 Tax=Niveomyces insectorum RCEF 264 TaxID=1081102 RepID=A0A167LX09_9HYPO|nr:hypothetical protein SPI_09330 [Niveomyces insectorum RCEF 264]